MPRLTLEAIGLKVIEKRGDRGVREAAKEIGTSPATLSRVERGHLPDLETFGKICRWLGVDPGEVLGTKTDAGPARPVVSIQTHFRKDDAVHPATAQALADLIIKAHQALVLLDEGEEFATLV
jgi:transcriptional regulator with XRE-family HTH domain